ncbi:GNAT family N-acetyltransferase [Paenibacillus endoradicis]|uniref:GNAT family N-acetyltransferase n=1 Tax=Paenibacillus endoradicis TaxID=2972487 RepID=UPI0021596F81|nr:GNAT family N-acetyltransferase [Paenibacillus endoradicis]MCR8656704.1 GNAT family N-acetyltransferase [Paenibacillus endoradicis]
MVLLSRSPTLLTPAKKIEKMIETSNHLVNLLKESFDSGLYLKETGELVGTISLNKFHGSEKELDYVEIGFGIGEAYQGNGYATEAAKTVVTWGIEKITRALF